MVRIHWKYLDFHIKGKNSGIRLKSKYFSYLRLSNELGKRRIWSGRRTILRLLDVCFQSTNCIACLQVCSQRIDDCQLPSSSLYKWNCLLSFQEGRISTWHSSPTHCLDYISWSRCCSTTRPRFLDHCRYLRKNCIWMNICNTFQIWLKQKALHMEKL